MNDFGKLFENVQYRQGMRRLRVTRKTRKRALTGISRFWRRLRVLEVRGSGRLGVRGA